MKTKAKNLNICFYPKKIKNPLEKEKQKSGVKLKEIYATFYNSHSKK